MPVSNAVLNWTLTMPAGSLQIWAFTFTNPGTGTPYDISGATGWEFVARTSATDLTVPPLIDITTVTTTPGNIVVTSTASLSQVLLTINPAATVNITPGEYALSLWMSPGTSAAYSWVSGPLIIQATAQP